MNRLSLLSLVLVSLAACGDDVGNPDARVVIDGARLVDATVVDAAPGTPDAQVFDAAPVADAKVSSVQIVACPASGTVDVVASDFKFDKATYSVAVDGVVKFSVSSANAHTMTSTGADAFESGSLTNASAPVCFKFTAAGSFPFRCNIHVSMTATVTVQ